MKLDMKKLFYGIQKKLLLYSLILSCAIILIFSYVVVKVISSETKTMEKQYLSITEKLIDNFDKFYAQMNDMTGELIIDTYVQNSMSKDYMTITDKENLEEIISYKINEDIMYYFCVNDFGDVYSNKNVMLNQQKFQASSLYSSLETDYAKLHLVWTEENIFGVSGHNLYVCRNIQNIESVEEELKLYFLVNKDAITDIFSEKTELEQYYLLISDTGELCYSQRADGNNIDDKIMQSVQNIIKSNQLMFEKDTLYVVESKEGMFYGKYHSATGFTIATFIPQESMNQVLYEAMQWVMIVMVIALIVAFGLSIYFSKHFSNPIRMIADTMVHFDNESLEQNITITTNTELDQIGNAYNTMLERISGLMDTVRKKENEVRELEMESLLYQIHPHFLYNTLENIYMLARINKQNQIMNMVDALSKFLRTTLSNGREDISIGQELEHVRAYMEIQKIRNNDLFSYLINCDKSIQKYIVPKMFLQPMVENSIKHGFADITEGGHIDISVKIQNEKLLVEVKDNGCGMDEVTLQRMNALLQSGDEKWELPSEKATGGYGIGNVVRRLKMKYGDDVTLKYIIEESGTLCRIEFKLDVLVREKDN